MGFFYFSFLPYICEMVISDKLKKIIFKKLYEDLSHVEIIAHDNSIWFIDRETKYWYFEYEKNGKLWWRYGFFQSFFVLFSLEVQCYQSILAEWVEEVLNCKINTPSGNSITNPNEVEEVLNCKVNTPPLSITNRFKQVEEVLNCKVNTPSQVLNGWPMEVEEVLNCKIHTTQKLRDIKSTAVEEVLNCKIHTTVDSSAVRSSWVEEVLELTDKH